MKFLVLSLFISQVAQAKTCLTVISGKHCRDNGICLVVMNDGFETLALDPLVGNKMCKQGLMPYYLNQ